MALSLHSPAEVAAGLASRVRARRLARGWTQEELARRAGIALSTLKLFEHHGHISFVRLLRIAAALDDLDSFTRIFEAPRARSLDEIEARGRVFERKNGRSIGSGSMTGKSKRGSP